jgi:ornithine carbamoyltransferase
MSRPELTNDQIQQIEVQLSRKEILRGDPARSFLTVSELSRDAFDMILATAHEMKKSPGKYNHTFLSGKKVALLFQKTSTRTKESFATGIYELGMMSSYIDWRQSNFTLSALEDEIKVLSQWYDAIMARVYHHEDLLTMKQYSEVPIINGLCDKYHPCQALADSQTVQEYFGPDLHNVKLAYIGDGNNVCNSLIEASALAGVGLISVATPDIPKHRPSGASEAFAGNLTSYEWSSSVERAVEDANVVYTDTWISMGQEAETQERERIFASFRISADVMAKASPHHIFMHDMPAHPGKEVEADVLRGYRSAVFQQAQNRKHAQKALLHYVLAPGV